MKDFMTNLGKQKKSEVDEFSQRIIEELYKTEIEMLEMGKKFSRKCRESRIREIMDITGLTDLIYKESESERRSETKKNTKTKSRSKR